MNEIRFEKRQESYDHLIRSLDEMAAMFARMRIDNALLAEICKVANLLSGVAAHGGTILLCGNGGSSAQASHFAGELVAQFMVKNRPAISAISLSDNTPVITAISNDNIYDDVFARAVEAHGRVGDALVLFSTSGNSKNLLRAAECARGRGIATVGILGRDGGPLKSLVDMAIVVPAESTPRIQEMHTFLLHILSYEVERAVARMTNNS